MYNSQEIADKIKKEATEKNVKLGAMFSDLDITNNTLHNMKKSMPSIQTLAKIAEYLDCSLDELCGTEKETAPDDIRSRAIKKINSLSDDQLKHFLNLLDSLDSLMV